MEMLTSGPCPAVCYNILIVHILQDSTIYLFTYYSILLFTFGLYPAAWYFLSLVAIMQYGTMYYLLRILILTLVHVLQYGIIYLWYLCCSMVLFTYDPYHPVPWYLLPVHILQYGTITPVPYPSVWHYYLCSLSFSMALLPLLPIL